MQTRLALTLAIVFWSGQVLGQPDGKDVDEAFKKYRNKSISVNELFRSVYSKHGNNVRSRIDIYHRFDFKDVAFLSAMLHDGNFVCDKTPAEREIASTSRLEFADYLIDDLCAASRTLMEIDPKAVGKAIRKANDQCKMLISVCARREELSDNELLDIANGSTSELIKRDAVSALADREFDNENKVVNVLTKLTISEKDPYEIKKLVSHIVRRVSRGADGGVDGKTADQGHHLAFDAGIAKLSDVGTQEAQQQAARARSEQERPQEQARAATPESSESNGDTWRDPQSGLTWQVSHPDRGMNWSDAKAYCSNLNLGGYSDWRLPNIRELRSLIRGCDGGKHCGNLKAANRKCTPCDREKAPGGRCFWPSDMYGSCSCFWSSSRVAGSDNNVAWFVCFDNGSVDNGDTGSDGVRCVR